MFINRYTERLSKNDKANIQNWFQVEHFKAPVISYDSDVLLTFKCMVEYMPEKSRSSHMFLCPILNSTCSVWYKDINVGIHIVRRFFKTMADNACMKGCDITNKTGRATTIT